MNYQYIHDSIVTNAKRRNWTKKTAGQYTETHHIVLRAMGGSDHPDNLIVVTAREHFLLHKLLFKIHGCRVTGQAYMSFAIMASKRSPGEFIRISSRDFEKSRALNAIYASERMKKNSPGKGKFGKLHTNHYCLWVTPEGTFESVYEAQQKTGLGKSTIHRRCLTDNEKILSSDRLGVGLIGKSWKELGYGIIKTKKRN